VRTVNSPRGFASLLFVSDIPPSLNNTPSDASPGDGWQCVNQSATPRDQRQVAVRPHHRVNTPKECS
jgi:hypothetical protein